MLEPSAGCRTKYCVPSATANELFPALNVVALAKDVSSLFPSVTVRNAAELAVAAAMFVVVWAKSKMSSPIQSEGILSEPEE